MDIDDHLDGCLSWMADAKPILDTMVELDRRADTLRKLADMDEGYDKSTLEETISLMEKCLAKTMAVADKFRSDTMADYLLVESADDQDWGAKEAHNEYLQRHTPTAKTFLGMAKAVG